MPAVATVVLVQSAQHSKGFELGRRAALTRHCTRRFGLVFTAATTPELGTAARDHASIGFAPVWFSAETHVSGQRRTHTDDKGRDFAALLIESQPEVWPAAEGLRTVDQTADTSRRHRYLRARGDDLVGQSEEGDIHAAPNSRNIMRLSACEIPTTHSSGTSIHRSRGSSGRSEHLSIRIRCRAVQRSLVLRRYDRPHDVRRAHARVDRD
jgi:hypothetical protein